MSRALKIAPLVVFELYFLFTLCVFLAGPRVDVSVTGATAVTAYALSGQALIAIGYLFGLRMQPRGCDPRVPTGTLAHCVIVASGAMFVLAILCRTNSDVPLREALSDPGAAYFSRQRELAERTATPLFSFVRGFAGPVTALFLPIGVVFRRRLSLGWKALWVTAFAVQLLSVLLSGASKGLFDIVLVLPWLIAVYWGGQPDAWKPERRWHSLARCACDALLATVFVGAALGTFTANKAARIRARDPVPAATASAPPPTWFKLPAAGAAATTAPIAPATPRYGTVVNILPRETTGWSRETFGFALPPATEFKLWLLSRYFAGGYHGLAGCLQLPFVPCYGAGHSFVLMQYAGRLFEDPLYLRKRCYPERLQTATGYSATGVFHTIYPWLASDLTFPGALLFMAWMAYLWSRAWSDALVGENPFAVAFLTQILLMFYFVPCNNVRLGFSEEIIAFWTLLLAWRLTQSARQVA